MDAISEKKKPAAPNTDSQCHFADGMLCF